MSGNNDKAARLVAISIALAITSGVARASDPSDVAIATAALGNATGGCLIKGDGVRSVSVRCDGSKEFQNQVEAAIATLPATQALGLNEEVATPGFEGVDTRLVDLRVSSVAFAPPQISTPSTEETEHLRMQLEAARAIQVVAKDEPPTVQSDPAVTEAAAPEDVSHAAIEPNEEEPSGAEEVATSRDIETEEVHTAEAEEVAASLAKAEQVIARMQQQLLSLEFLRGHLDNQVNDPAIAQVTQTAEELDSSIQMAMRMRQQMEKEIEATNQLAAQIRETFPKAEIDALNESMGQSIQALADTRLRLQREVEEAQASSRRTAAVASRQARVLTAGGVVNRPLIGDDTSAGPIEYVKVSHPGTPKVPTQYWLLVPETGKDKVGAQQIKLSSGQAAWAVGPFAEIGRHFYTVAKKGVLPIRFISDIDLMGTGT